MNARMLPVVLVTFLVSGATAVAASLLLFDRGQPVAAAQDEGIDPAGEVSLRLRELGRRQEELARSVEELRRGLESRASAGSRVSLEDIEAAVRRELAGRQDLGALAGSGAGSSAKAAAALRGPGGEGDALGIEAAFALLQDPALGDVERQELWKRFAEQGLSDALIAEYERRAEESPLDPDLQVELGGAYLQKIFEVGNSPLAGVWATKADKAFDAALELDPQHWDARFHKAVSLSFWPPVFGKQGEAIRHFEVLIEQQAGLSQEPRFADTHVLLGNMYRQIGDKDQAIAAWQRGLRMFPGNATLLEQLKTFGGQ